MQRQLLSPAYSASSMWTANAATVFPSSDTAYQALVTWVHRYYRDELALADLLDPSLLQESNAALEALIKILRLDNSYEL